MLTSICLPGTDDSYHIVPLCERYDQQAASIRMADHDFPIFVFRVVLIFKDAGKRVLKHGRSFREVDAMLASVSLGLLWVPFKAYGHVE
jgi:hypothetical protein